MSRALTVAAALFWAACGSAHHPAADLSMPVHDLAADSGFTPGDGGPQACSPTKGCLLPRYVCAYAIAQGCSATSGICIPLSGGASCGALRILCGCNGNEVDGDGDCNFPLGYASGPTSATAPCGSSDDGGDADGGAG